MPSLSSFNSQLAWEEIYVENVRGTVRMYTRIIWKEDKNGFTDNKLFTAQILKKSQQYLG